LKIFRAKVSQLEETNGSLQNNLSVFEKKYNRCTEDNQRLKWILRTIQQREEILLTHNKCFNSELLQEEKNQQALRPKSPSHIEILKANRNQSFVSSQPYFSGTTQNTNNGEDCSECKFADPQPPIATVIYLFIFLSTYLLFPLSCTGCNLTSFKIL
jgi:hypothetical protein